MKTIQRLIMMGTKPIENMTEEEAKLLALLVDTEGSIMAKMAGSFHICPLIAVSMRSHIPIDTAEKWGGTLFKNWEHGKWSYKWLVAERKTLRIVLLKIKPYLQLKQKQAKLALDMCDVADKKDAGWKEELKRLKAEINKLNHPPSLDIDINKLKGVIIK